MFDTLGLPAGWNNLGKKNFSKSKNSLPKNIQSHIFSVRKEKTKRKAGECASLIEIVLWMGWWFLEEKICVICYFL